MWQILVLITSKAGLPDFGCFAWRRESKGNNTPEIKPKKFQMTYFDTPNKVSSTKFGLKSFPGLADVGVPHGDGYGPRTAPRCGGAGLEKISND